MGLSENRVYSQWNSHLIGIMISKTIGFRGTNLFSDTSKWQKNWIHGSQTIVSTWVKALGPDQSVHKALLEEGAAAALTPVVIEVYHIILYIVTTEYLLNICIIAWYSQLLHRHVSSTSSFSLSFWGMEAMWCLGRPRAELPGSFTWTFLMAFSAEDPDCEVGTVWIQG